ncbi:lambda family phage tail tape measure protein [Pseudaminobacter salicylatoxidans]|uniref:Lambda family phage tail tape measure protein n=1 Tax=Pseudaminobacter salicylatoxidans TaxID=93369 RepID=A0A316C0E0_PSESE|nr:tape measure protein [Pseudaminobacter salicylatoxidans]PWJ81476.1 lambda family phage tail tape measure protein [Pseudaminobacter salicylatoxidans]
MDIAGLVKVKVQADLSELDRGFAEGRSKSQAFDREASRTFSNLGRNATVAGSAARAANDNIAGSATRAALAYDGLNKAMLLASSAIGTIAGAAIGTALIKYSDAWSDMQSRVGAAIKDMDAAPALMQRIVDIANASYSPLDQTVEIYSRNVSVLRDLGKGASEAADFTEALNHALVLTATRGERAASVQNALSKAMAVGKLQADGLETILANGGEVAQALADELGTTVNGLRKMASEGKITGSVIAEALIKRLDDLRERAGEMPATIGDAFTRIQTNLTAFIGQMDKASGASEAVATALLSLADNIGRVVTYGATAVTMYGTYYVAAFVAARVATVGLTGALTLLRAALIRTGIGALIVAAGELIYQFTRLVEATGSFSGALQEMGRRSEILLDAVVWSFRAAAETIQSIWYGAMADILRATEDSMGGILRTLGVSAESMGTAIEGFTARAKQMGEVAASSAAIAAEQFKTAFGEIKLPEFSGSGGSGRAASDLGKIDKAAQKAAKAYERITERAVEFIRQQELEAQVIGMTQQAAQALRFEQDLLNEARRAGLKLTASDKQGFKALAEAMAEAEERTRVLTERFEFMKDLTKGFFSDFKNDLINNMSQGMSFWESAWRAMANAALNALDRIVDKLMNDVLDALFEVKGAGSGGGGLLGGLLGLFGLGGGGAAAAADPWAGLRMAKGGAFANGISGFSNTIVDRATPFRFANGAGIMGEAGPEAIMPLKRGPDGRLGVSAPGAANQNQQTNVNITVDVRGANGNTEIREMVDQGVKAGLAKYEKGASYRASRDLRDAGARGYMR